MGQELGPALDDVVVKRASGDFLSGTAAEYRMAPIDMLIVLGSCDRIRGL